MSPSAEAIAAPAGGLLAGHFRQSKKYVTSRPAGTDDWLLIFTRSGQGLFCWEGGKLIVRRGDLVLTRPGTPHDYGLVQPGEPWELQWVHFLPRPHWSLWLQWAEISPGLSLLRLRDKALVQRISSRLTDVQRLSGQPLLHHETLAMNALEEVLLWCDEVSAGAGALDPRLRAAVDLFNNPQMRSSSFDEVARKVGLSTSRLAHLFAEQMGDSPRRYVEKRKIEHGRQLLLRTQLPISEIAREVGFESQFYFSLRFKKATGSSPTAYRARR